MKTSGSYYNDDVGDIGDVGGEGVHLAIYDISNGMARTLSRQFLGVTIDMIPHTSILVFGREYYYGGGIQSCDPTTFRSSTGLIVSQTIFLGRTAVRRSDFDGWCRTVGTQHFHEGSYDLLQRNCNHFCHEAALNGLRLSKGVPNWILQVPNQFLSSPIGQMIRPMLEDMQITRLSPVVDVPSSSLSSSLSSSVSSSPILSSSTSNQVQNNPWATNPTTTTSTVSASCINTVPTQSTSTTRSVNNAKSTTTTAAAAATTTTTTYILNRYKLPMLSQDTSTIDLCMKKLLPTLVSLSVQQQPSSCTSETTTTTTTKAASSSSSSIMDQRQLIWETFFHRLKTKSRLGGNHSNDEGNLALIESSVHELWNLLMTDTSVIVDVNNNNNNNNRNIKTTSLTLYLLLVLRLVVLDPSGTIGRIPSFVMEWMTTKMEQQQTDGWMTPSARSLAWCVLSNSIATTTTNNKNTNDDNNTANDPSIQQRLVDAALADLIPERQCKVEVRQAASTYLYNYVLKQQQQEEQPSTPKDENHHHHDDDDVVAMPLDDMLVSILCSNIDGSVLDEADPTTQLRRLLVVGRILIPIGKEQHKQHNIINDDNQDRTSSSSTTPSTMNKMAHNLAYDVGFHDNTLRVLVSQSNTSSVVKDAIECRALAGELLSYLDQSVN